MRNVLPILLLIPSISFAQTQHDRIDARGQVKTDKFINRQTVIITGATPNVAAGNIFKTNNGGSVAITNFLGGVDSQQITIICGDGNTSISNNANIATSSGGDFSCGVNQSIAFVYDAVQAKWIQSGSVNGGNGGGTPGGVTNDIQKKNSGGSFAPAAESDDGATFSVGIDAQFHGPNPNFDLRAFGGYAATATPPSTTGSITAAQTTLILANAQDFKNGQGIVVYKAGPNPTITTPGQPTITPINLGGGGTTYTYQAIAEQRNGALTAAGVSGSTTIGRATLGSNSVSLTNCTRVSGVATYTASTTHNIVAGTQINISGFGSGLCTGVKTIATTPTGTTFTTNDGSGAADENISAAGNATVFACNKLDFPSGSYSGANTLRYWIYRNNALVGVAQGIDPFFIDCGLPAPTAPSYIPSTPPGAAQPGYLATTIVSGGGATTLTLANAASNTAATQTVLHDNSSALLACVQATLTNQSGGGTCYVPNPNGSFNFWTFNATTDFSTLTTNNNSHRIHLAGNVNLNQPWVLISGMDIEGEARINGSFQYVSSTKIAGNGYPLLYAPPLSSLHLNRLQLSVALSQQIGLLTDQNTSTGGSVGVISDDVGYFGNSGNNIPVVIKSGFDFYFNRGVMTNNGASFGPMPSFLETINSPAVVGGLTNLMPYRTRIDGTEIDHRGILFDCSPEIAQNYFSHKHEFRNILYETANTPFLRLNCPGTGSGSQFTDFNFYNIEVADSGAVGTPVMDAQQTKRVFAAFQSVMGLSSSQPIFIAGSGSSMQGSGMGGQNNLGNTTYFSATAGNAFANGVIGVASSGRFYSGLTSLPPAPTLVVSAGGSVPIGTENYKLSCTDVEGVETTLGPSASVVTSSGNQTVSVSAPSLPLGCNAYMAYRDIGGGAYFRDNATPVPAGPTFTAVDTFSFTHGDSPQTTNLAAVLIADGSRVSAPLLQHLDTSGFTVSTGVPAPLTANRTFRFPDATGTACISTLCAVNSVTINGDAALSSSPRTTPPIFFPGALTSTWTGASWTLDKAITVTRVQTAAKFAPSGCSTSAIIRLTDGTTPVNLTLNAATNDSGVIAQNYAAGATLTVSVNTAASGCASSPGDVNVLLQSRMQ